MIIALRVPLLVRAAPLAFAVACCWNPFRTADVAATDPAQEQPAAQEVHVRPKVLLLSIDTLRWDNLSFNGYPAPTSPALDGLMGEGVAFDRALAAIPRTTQSLTSVLTGRYPHGHGVRVLVDRLPPDVPTVATMARDAGYTTVAVVSNHVLGRKRGLARGFDVYDQGGDARDAARTTAAAIAQLQEIDQDEPAFVWVHYIDPHVPYAPEPEHVALLDPGYQGRYPLRFGDVDGGVGNRAYPADLPKRVAVFANPLDAATNEHVKKLYAAEVRSTDDAVGDLLRFLEERFEDDWLVVFTADHGESQGEHDYWWDHGDYVWQPELHVPLSFTFAEGDPLRRADRVPGWVSLVDVAPTLAELMELEWPEGARERLDGRSLVPALRGERMDPRPVFAECDTSFFFPQVRGRTANDVASRFRAVIDGDDKLIWTPGAAPGEEYRLHHLTADPLEANDLAAKEPARVAELKGFLDAWMRGDTPPPRTPDAEDLELLQGLGYVDDLEPAAEPPR